jgi:uncharacterized membrane protein YccC
MYALSRSLYRDLAPMLTHSVETAEGRADRQQLLTACEQSIRRLVLEPDNYAHPVRSLFREVQHLIPLTVQVNALEIVRVHVEAGRELSRQLQPMMRRECAALTKRGTPCQREPEPGQRFCPSHRHLDLEEIPVAPAEVEAAA